MDKYIKENNVSLLYDKKSVITSGYWNDKVFISSEGQSIVFDITNKKIYNSSSNYFALKTKHNKSSAITNAKDRVQSLNGGDYTTRYTIVWHHSKHGMQSFNVDYFANPQVNNAVSFNSYLLARPKAIGLFVKNYRVKYMKVPTLETTSYGKLYRNKSKADTDLLDKTISTKELMQMNKRLINSKQFNALA